MQHRCNTCYLGYAIWTVHHDLCWVLLGGGGGGCLMVWNANFNNMSVISWRSVLLVEETEDLEKTTDLSQVTDKLYRIMLYTSPWSRFELTTSVVIGTDCIGSYESNYHAITATTGPSRLMISDEMSIHIVLQIAALILVSMVHVIGV